MSSHRKSSAHRRYVLHLTCVIHALPSSRSGSVTQGIMFLHCWTLVSKFFSFILSCQVLLYDPLSSWTLSPEKRKELQKAEEDHCDFPPSNTTSDYLDGSVMPTENAALEDNVNKMAKRMLLRLKQKLDGVEDGVHLSVSGQVNHLIREAMDPKNLCRLFSGWQPWVWSGVNYWLASSGL